MILVQIQVVHFFVVLLSVLDLHVVVLFYQRVILKHLHQYCCNYDQVLLLEMSTTVVIIEILIDTLTHLVGLPVSQLLIQH